MTFNIIEDNILSNEAGVTIRLADNTVIYAEGANMATFAAEAGIPTAKNASPLTIIYWPVNFEDNKLSAEKVIGDIKEAFSVTGTEVEFSPIWP